MGSISRSDSVPLGRRHRECPHDFEAMFVRLGRLECEEHYRAGQDTVTRWLDECGKDRLIRERAAFVRNRRAANARQNRLKREMTRILQQTFPVAEPSLTLVREAAHFLRSIRNGGWIVSPAGDGFWWVGSKRRSADELLQLAVAKGFDPATLSREGEGG